MRREKVRGIGKRHVIPMATSVALVSTSGVFVLEAGLTSTNLTPAVGR
jgi:hypothetical protein